MKSKLAGLVFSVPLLLLNAQVTSAAELLDSNKTSASATLRPAAFIISQEDAVSIPMAHRILLPQASYLTGSSAEIVYRWERLNPDGSPVYQLEEAPSTETDSSVRSFLRSESERRYACYEKTPYDFSDIAPRAFLGEVSPGVNEVVIFAGHTTTFATRGSSFRVAKRDCRYPLYHSQKLDTYSAQRQTEWLSSLYTRDGKKIYGIVNNDWRAYRDDSVVNEITYLKEPVAEGCMIKVGEDKWLNRCNSADRWWWGALTSVVMERYQDAAAGLSNFQWSSVVAQAPESELNAFQAPAFPGDKTFYGFNGEGTSAAGFVHTTNILKSPVNGYLYMISKRLQSLPKGATKPEKDDAKGFCLMRALHTADLGRGDVWFGMSSSAPGGYTRELVDGKCDFLFKTTDELKTAANDSVEVDSIRHLSYNRYLRKFVALAKAWVTPANSTQRTLMLVLLTTGKRNLTGWTEDNVIPIMPVAAERTISQGTIVKYEAQYYNLIDHKYVDEVNALNAEGLLPAGDTIQARRNFDVTGQRPWLYISLKRSIKKTTMPDFEHAALDVVRIPLQLAK